MKLNKIMLATVVAMGMGMVSMANAAVPTDQGHGKVTFKGSIIDAPCSITPETADQTVDFGPLGNASLMNGGKSAPKPFSIDLENCVFTGDKAKNKVTVTFTGDASAADPDMLGVTGTASGISVALTEFNGTKLKLGEASKATDLLNTPSVQQLKFSSYVQGDGASSTITEGDFRAIANFTLAYN
jgi:type 1 fimbria pilin